MRVMTDLPCVIPYVVMTDLPCVIPYVVMTDLPCVIPYVVMTDLPCVIPYLVMTDLPCVIPYLVMTDLPCVIPYLVITDLPCVIPYLVMTDLPCVFPYLVMTDLPCVIPYLVITDLPCTEESPTCGDTCGRLLPCGEHYCVMRCHAGPCEAVSCTFLSVMLSFLNVCFHHFYVQCRQLRVKSCRCGKHKRSVLCTQPYFCEEKCTNLRQCGIHQCKRKVL